MGGYENARIIDLGPLRFNPGVTLIGFCVLWGIAIYCIQDELGAKAELSLWQSWVHYWFTWLYIGSQDIWILFALYVYVKHGTRKLCAPGDETDKPEFTDAAFFMMLFTCGVAVGMFFFGVNEPVYHYLNSRYANDEANHGAAKAQWGITLTVFHWGLHGWIPYCLVGLTLGFASYRQDKPLTMRSALYPVLGDRVNGWIGDSIDALSIIVVVAGVCTSLGLGTQQIASGINRLDQDVFDANDVDETKNAWTLIIVVITLVACGSVVSGINVGIKGFSMVAFCLANFIWLMVFTLDDPVYFLDVMVQSTGHYLQYFLEMGFMTDAFIRQKQHGNAGTHTADVDVDAVPKPGYLFPGAPVDNNDGSAGGNPSMLGYWTIFYWGWWIAWSPFVGMFIARISKGRTVREVFNYSMTAPLAYVIIWFSVFGGGGIKMHNSAMECKGFHAGSLELSGGAYGGSDPFAVAFDQTICCPIHTTFRKTGAWEILRVKGPYNSSTLPLGVKTEVPKICEALRPINFGCTNAHANIDALFNTNIAVSGTLTLPTCTGGQLNTAKTACLGAGTFAKCTLTGATCTNNGAATCVTDENGVTTTKCGCSKVHHATMNESDYTNDYVFDQLNVEVKDFLQNPTTTVTRDDTRRVIYEFKTDASNNLFELLEQYHGWGDFLCGTTIITIIFYFVTSSDSGSYVVDLISAGGDRDKDGKKRDPHWIQRVIWSLTEGALAIGLMRAGDSLGSNGATKALQAMSITVGLPFTVVLCFMMPSLLRMLEFEAGTAKPEDYQWKMNIFGGILDVFDVVFSFGGKLGGCPSMADLVTSAKEFAIGFVPVLHAQKTLAALDTDGKKKNFNMARLFAIGFLWLFWWISIIIEYSYGHGWFAMASTAYFAMAVLLAGIRGDVRTAQGIKGNVFEDFMCCFLLYPNAGAQCWHQVGGGAKVSPAEKVDAAIEAVASA